MARSQADLVAAAYAEVTLDGQAPASEDVNAIQARVAPLVADLAARRVIVVGNVEAIADAIFLPLARVLALWVGPIFGKERDEDAVRAAESVLAESDRASRSAGTPLVRRVLDELQIWGAGQTTIDATLVAERIPGALASLSARNIIYLADEDAIPDGAAPAVARYIAGFLAPKIAGEAVAQAEGELRVIARIGRGTRRTLRVDAALRPRCR